VSRSACLAWVFLVGCPSMPFRDYEVPPLPEEAVMKSLSVLPQALERGEPGRLAGAYAADARGTAPGERAPLADGREGLVESWGRYLAGFRTIARAELKPRDLHVEEAAARGAFLLSVQGVDRDGRFRQDRFRIEFALRLSGAGWEVTEQSVGPGESVRGRRTRFRNIARESGADYPHRILERHVPGSRLHGEVNADSGVSAADVDGDGWVDLYFCDGARNALLRNRGDGTFEDVTARAGLEEPSGLTRCAALFDADNDGDPDLFVARERAPCRFYRNRGDGTFSPAEGSGLEYVGFPSSLAVADYDGDGLIDLYLGVYGDAFNEFPSLDRRNGGANVLFRNLGDLRFRDVSGEAGVGDRGWTLAVAWGDLDGDGDPDLFVCNDWGPSSVYRNDRGRFSDVTRAAGLGAPAFGMSAAFGDYDNDGDLDLFAPGMYSNAGQWLFKRREMLPVPWFLAGLRNRVLGTLDGMTDGNRLLRNDGGRFSEVARAAGVDYGQFAWGGVWVDFDNDGYLDLYGANGFWSGPDAEDT